MSTTVIPYWLDHCPACDAKCTGACKCLVQHRVCPNGHTWRRNGQNNPIMVDGPCGNDIPHPKPTEADFVWAEQVIDELVESQETCSHPSRLALTKSDRPTWSWCFECGGTIMECGHLEKFLGEDGECDECCDEEFDAIQSIVDEAGMCTCNIICPEHKAPPGVCDHAFSSATWMGTHTEFTCSVCGHVQRHEGPVGSKMSRATAPPVTNSLFNI